MYAVSAKLRTFATELSNLKAEMNNPLLKIINTRLLLFGTLLNLPQFKRIKTEKNKMQSLVLLGMGISYLVL